ncbi:NADPH-dependent FMN reductase [Lactovum miscens]|uniref:NAD(P)H-dependent FMN reductase n=1 Tax=Lactovum miscens TaxID=190387 RepID=A0A841C968_9LACT|nr:NADPH-dependent FMN reductase [Lactovum miscens]MBB5888101.1 NAD(P)H-dependent FMN reductase [Lactovum miscens]
MNFIALVGTNASFSYNRKLLWFMKKHFGTQANIEIQEISDIPMFIEDAVEVPKRVNDLIQIIEISDGIIFSTPEYDHSISAALKSTIEWLSWGEFHPLTNRPVMIVGASLGNMGTVFAQENLRQILSSPGLNSFVLPGNQFLLGNAAKAFDINGNLIDERTITWLEHCFTAFISYVNIIKPISNQEEKLKSSNSSDKSENKVWTIEDFSQIDADTGASVDDEVDDELEANRLNIEEELAWALDAMESADE